MGEIGLSQLPKVPGFLESDSIKADDGPHTANASGSPFGDEDENSGQQLVEQVVKLTDLPEEFVLAELTQILVQNNEDPETLTLDKLRESLLKYLETFAPSELDAAPPTNELDAGALDEGGSTQGSENLN